MYWYTNIPFDKNLRFHPKIVQILIPILVVIAVLIYQNIQLRNQLMSSQQPQVPFPQSSTPLRPTPPPGWKAHAFSKQGLSIYTPSDWDSSIEDFPDTASALVRFWKQSSPAIVPIQLDIKPNWDNTGNAQNLAKDYIIAGNINAARVDPSRKEARALDRYQTNVYVEYQDKVYVFQCVHNWAEDYLSTCNTMLETITFTP